MYEYKSVTLVDFFFEEEIKSRRKEFEVENTEKRAINFMNLFLNYYSSKGWELDRTHKLDKSLDDAVDDFAKNKNLVFSTLGKIFAQKSLVGGYEFYIFKRRINEKNMHQHANNIANATIAGNIKSLTDINENSNPLDLPRVREDFVSDNPIPDGEANALIAKLKNYGYDFVSYLPEKQVWVLSSTNKYGGQMTFENTLDQLKGLVKNFE